MVHGVDATRLICDSERRGRDGDPERVTILVAAQRLNSQVLTGSDACSEVLAFSDQIAWYDEIVDVPADRLILGVAEHFRELPVEPDDVIVLVENCDCLGRVLE